MYSSTQKETLKQMKLAAIDRYGSVADAARALGVSRWQLRRAALGGSLAVRQKMLDAGLVDDVAANEGPQLIFSRGDHRRPRLAHQERVRKAALSLARQRTQMSKRPNDRNQE